MLIPEAGDESLDGACIVLDCGEPRFARGLCAGHYKRWSRGRSVDGPIHRVPATQDEALDLLRKAADERSAAERDEDYDAADRRLQHAARMFASARYRARYGLPVRTMTMTEQRKEWDKRYAQTEKGRKAHREAKKRYRDRRALEERS